MCGSCSKRNTDEDIKCVFDKYDENPLTIFLSTGQTIKNVMQSGCDNSNQSNISKISIEFYTEKPPVRIISINANDIVAICGRRYKYDISTIGD
ncbi:MAG: hypothetical protein KAQ85_00375 [Thermodesulfovibrionia bacterium]|nr:hypothetical protein [Thermodesulfovibrionia bacterium]